MGNTMAFSLETASLAIERGPSKGSKKEEENR